MIKIAISTEAFAAIVATMPLRTVAFEQDLNGMGQRYVWLEVAVADRLSAMRRPTRAIPPSSCGSSRLRQDGVASSP